MKNEVLQKLKHDADFAVVFEEIVDVLAIQDVNPRRIRAYRNAAAGLAGKKRRIEYLFTARITFVD